MHSCPHCGAPIKLSELMAKRLFSPRECRACRQQYFEGGTTVAIAVVSAAGAWATSMNADPQFAGWIMLLVMVVAAAVAVAYAMSCKPRKFEVWRSKLFEALVTAPIVAMVVWIALDLFA